MSRTFKGVVGVDVNARPVDLSIEVAKVRRRMSEFESWDMEDFMNNKIQIEKSVDLVINKILKSRE